MRSRALLATLCLFAGLTAIWGGAELVYRPDGSLIDLPLALLAHTPFRDFLVPGLLLALVVGGINTLAGVLVLLRHPRADAEAIVSGSVLAGWIVIEVLLLRGVHWLHGVYLALGIAIVAVAARRARAAGTLAETERALGLAVGHAFVGWALCAAIMGALMATTSPPVAIAIHALAAPLVFVGVSASYFRRAGAWPPLRAALVLASIVALLDLVIVACFVMRSLVMFRSFAGTWLPLLLVAVAIFLTGTLRGRRRVHREAHGA